MHIRLLTILFITLATTGCLESLFYYPDKVSYSSPSQARLAYQDVYFASQDGTMLHGWYIPAVGEEKGVILHYHGNAQNISGHFPLVYWLPFEGYSLFMFDYRGYGESQGSPDKAGLHADSIAAMNYLLNRSDISKANLFVLGQSLGGANAIDAVASLQTSEVKALVIESTFVSYPQIAAEKARELSSAGSLLAVSPALLPDDSYSPSENLGRMAPTPILFIHGTADQVIPLHHSQQLFALAKQPKALWVLEGAHHLEAFSRFLPQTRQRLLDYLEQHRDKSTTVQSKRPA